MQDVIGGDPVDAFETEEGVHPVNAESSIVDLLRKEAEEVAKPEPAYIPVTGYEGSGLAIRYQMPDKPKELNNLASKIERETKDQYDRNLMLGIDTMLRLSDGLFVRSEEAVSEDNPEGWVELGFDLKDTNKLCDTFGFPAEIANNARQTVRALFGNDLKINDHSARLQRWLLDSKVSVNASLWVSGE